MIRRLEDNIGTKTSGRIGMRRDGIDLRTKAARVVQAGAFLRISAHHCASLRIRAQAGAAMSGRLDDNTGVVSSYYNRVSYSALTSGDDIVLHISISVMIDGVRILGIDPSQAIFLPAHLPFLFLPPDGVDARPGTSAAGAPASMLDNLLSAQSQAEMSKLTRLTNPYSSSPRPSS